MDYQSFLIYQSYAMVGHYARENFLRITYNELKQCSKKIFFTVDRSVNQIDCDRTYPDLANLPEKVEAVKNQSVVIKLTEFLFCQLSNSNIY